MLHVDPSTAVIAARPAFDPIAYLTYCRACNVPVTIDRHNGEPRLSWDIHDIRADAQLRNNSDPHLDIDTDPEGKRKVYEVLSAEEWIAGARACGLVVAPWREKGSTIGSLQRGGVMHLGQAEDSRNSFGAATKRFLKHPARHAADECGEGVVFEVLCAEFGIDPDDPDLCSKVNARMAAEDAARRAREPLDDRELIRLCGRAKRALEKDLVATLAMEDLAETFLDTRPPKPTRPGIVGEIAEAPIEELRETLARARESGADCFKLALLRARIAAVLAWEKAAKLQAKAIGLTRAQQRCDRAMALSHDLVVAVAETPARTAQGLAHKAGVLASRKTAGYTLCEEGEVLAFSIAGDACILGTGGLRGGTPAPTRN